jgi:hypothetical protein
MQLGLIVSLAQQFIPSQDLQLLYRNHLLHYLVPHDLDLVLLAFQAQLEQPRMEFTWFELDNGTDLQHQTLPTLATSKVKLLRIDHQALINQETLLHKATMKPSSTMDQLLSKDTSSNFFSESKNNCFSVPNSGVNSFSRLYYCTPPDTLYNVYLF